MINYRYLQVPYWCIGTKKASEIREGDRFPFYADECGLPFFDVTCWLIVRELTENLIKVEMIGEMREPMDFDDTLARHARAFIESVFRPVLIEEDDD